MWEKSTGIMKEAAADAWAAGLRTPWRPVGGWPRGPASGRSTVGGGTDFVHLGYPV
jgi:hypothetical protein